MRIRLLSFIYAPPHWRRSLSFAQGRLFDQAAGLRAHLLASVPPPPPRGHRHTAGQSATSATSFLGHELAAAPLALASAATRLRRFIKKAASRLTPKMTAQ